MINKDRKYAEGGEVDYSKLLGYGAGSITDMFSSLINSGNPELMDELADYRTDPAKAMERLDKKAVGANIASSAIKGGAAGMATGNPLLGLAGTAGGAIVGGIKALAGRSDRETAREKATQDWSQFWGSRSAQNTAAAGYAKGGEIKGKGTSKSDNIRMSVPEGSFIVPAENASIALQYGKDYLEWDDNQVAERNYGNIDVKVSPKEMYFTPEESDALNYYGVDLDALAPDAKKNRTGFYAGREIAEFLKRDRTGQPIKTKSAPEDTFKDSVYQKTLDAEFNNMTPEEKIAFNAERKKAAETKIIAGRSAPKPPPKPPPDDRNFWDNIGTYAGIAQAAGGAAGLYEVGKRPDINVSKTLQRLSTQTRQEAGYGLPPAVKNEMKKQSARAFRATTNEITGRGGSAQDIYKQTMGALSRMLEEQGKTEVTDFQAKQMKIDRAVGVDLKLAGQEFDVEKMDQLNFENDQNIWANLLSTGIENTIGARQFKKELELSKLRAESNKTSITLGS